MMHQKIPTIFNVGSSKQNYTKEEIANTIGDLTGAKITFTDNEEKRNFLDSILHICPIIFTII